MLDVDLDAMPDEELDALIAAAEAVKGRRWQERHAPERARQIEANALLELDRVAAQWHAAVRGGAGTPDAPVPYEPPSAMHDVWPSGAVVTHSGRVWRNPAPANSDVPGAPGAPWVDITDQDGA